MRTFEVIATLDQWLRDGKINIPDYDLRLQAVYAGYPADALRGSDHVIIT